MHTVKNSTNILFVLILILTLVLGGVYAASFFSENTESIQGLPQNIPVTYHIWVTCPECTEDPLYVNDCIDFLGKIKDHPDFLKAAESINFDIARIYKIEKQVNVNAVISQRVRCYYYSPE